MSELAPIKTCEQQAHRESSALKLSNIIALPNQPEHGDEHRVAFT